MQKIIFILIAMIVNYIANGKSNYSSEEEELFGCHQENIKVETLVSNGISVLSQNQSGLPASSIPSELRERPQMKVALTDTDRSK